jgi:hypothetical protein
MNKDDVIYVLELLDEALENKDWDLIEEARQFLKEFSFDENPSKFDDSV